MGRPRLYDSDAARQRACRDRRAVTRREVDRKALEGLHQRLEDRQTAVAEAAHWGDPLALRCRAASVETVLEKLTAAFKELPQPPAPAPEGPSALAQAPLRRR